MALMHLHDVTRNDLPPHAWQTYQRVKKAGPPANPLHFPTASVKRSRFQTISVLDHHSGSVRQVKALVQETKSHVAYYYKKTISKTTFGATRLYLVLRRLETRMDHSDVHWITSEEMVAIKESNLAKTRPARGERLKDPIKEAACLQLVGSYHPNILGCLEVLQSDECLYVVMPYCSGGDLCSLIHKRGKTKQATANEVQARVWFRQLLEALLHLQNKGVCHRDLCLENIMLEEDGNLVVADFGLALRVPYADNNNDGCVSDVSEGESRLLMKNPGQSGTLTYLDPAIIEREEAFDGFAADLWSAGVLLFVFLVGLAPFKWASTTDFRYNEINSGRLKELMQMNFTKPISDEAYDLLQNMLWRDPRKRLTLAEVMCHPWVVGGTRRTTTFSKAKPALCNVKNLPRWKLSHKKNESTDSTASSSTLITI